MSPTPSGFRLAITKRTELIPAQGEVDPPDSWQIGING
jgi:hypothetical protein